MADRATLRAHVVLAAWSVPAALACSQRFAISVLGVAPMPAWRLMVTVGVPWYAWAALTPIIDRVVRRYPLRAWRRPRVVVAHVTACGVSQSVYSAAYTIVAFMAGTIPVRFAPLQYFVVTALGFMPTMTLVYSAVVGVLAWRAADARERVREREAAELAGQLAQAQLGALRMQLHPHFLFNALHTVAVLVGEEERDTALQLLVRLGSVLRAVVRGDPAREIPLSEEIALIGEYLDIEQVRFADRLRVEWDLDAAVLDRLVPVFVLQPLVENALRHGVGRAPAGGLLQVGATMNDGMLELWVYDDGPRGAAHVHGAGEEAGQGIGLSNTRERITRLYGPRATLALEPTAEGGMRARVRIPLRSLTTTTMNAAAPRAVAHA